MLEKEKFDASLRLKRIACKVQAGAALNYSDTVYAIALYLGGVSDTLLAFAEEFGGEA